jgi:hypothetical protein
MSRVLFVTAAVVLVATPAVPAPQLKDAGPAGYFPTTVGARWVYQSGQVEQTEVVTDVRKDGEATIVAVGSVGPDGKVTPGDTVAIRPDGLFLLSETGQPYDPPVCLLRFPVKVGDRWEAETSRPDIGKVRFVREVKETKTRETPAGKFEAVRVESAVALGAAVPNTHSHWYAPGVGVVEIERTRTLKSFEPGKK